MDHISDSEIILNKTILTLREIYPFDSTLLNFPINLQSVLKGSQSKDISKYDSYSSCQKDYNIIFQSPQMPTKMFIILLDLNFKVTILLLT